MAIDIRRRADKADMEMVGVSLRMAHDRVVALLAVRILDHRLQLGIRVPLRFGVIVERSLEIVIDEDVLNLAGLEKILEDEPILLNIERRIRHVLEAQIFFVGSVDIADSDIAPGLMRKMR